jgi:hypothetical protein
MFVLAYPRMNPTFRRQSHPAPRRSHTLRHELQTDDRGVLHVFVIQNPARQVLSVPFEGKATQVLFGDARWAETVAERMERYRAAHGVWPQLRTSFQESDGLPPSTGAALVDLHVVRESFDEIVANAAKFRIDLMLVDEIAHLECGPLSLNGHVIQFEPSADMVQRMWDTM